MFSGRICRNWLYLTIRFLLLVFSSAPVWAQDCTPSYIELNSQQEVDNFQADHGPCDRADSIQIEGPEIVNLDGLSALTSVAGVLYIQENPVLNNVDGLSALATVSGTLLIKRNAQLTHLDGLSSLTSLGGLTIQENSLLTNVNGLSSLTDVKGEVYIGFNDALTNLDGMSSLSSARNIRIFAPVKNVDFLSRINSLSGYLYIGGNALSNINGLSALTRVGGELVIQSTNVLTNVDGLSSLTSAGALVLASNHALADVDGLSALSSVGALTIQDNWVLTNLDALSAITNLSHLRILSNFMLSDLSGLSALSSVTGNVQIALNDELVDLDGLSALTNVSGDLEIRLNNAMKNVDGLSLLSIVGGKLWIAYNATLTNLNGLYALQTVHELNVDNNPSLADCLGLATLVDPIDDYQPGPGPGPAGIPDITDVLNFENNLDGCNSVPEILSEVPLPEINAGLNDAWYNPETDGQGFLLVVFPEIKQIFMAWFTYDTVRPPMDVQSALGEPGHRWLTAQGGYENNIAKLDLYVTSGGVFDSPQPIPIAEPDGHIIVEFNTCNSGTVSYEIPSIDRRHDVPIERIVLDNVSACYLLGNQAE